MSEANLVKNEQNSIYYFSLFTLMPIQNQTTTTGFPRYIREIGTENDKVSYKKRPIRLIRG